MEDLKKRVELLEAEVSLLKAEIENLKANQTTIAETKVTPVTIEKELPPEPTFVEKLKAVNEQAKAEKVVQPETTQEVTQKDFEELTFVERLKLKEQAEKTGQPVPSKVKPKKEKKSKSFEELLISILPKVFMFILVLGVLWGLKLASDKGYLTDGVKILLAYSLSIALGVVAFVLEKKKKSAPVMHTTLYGGSFIIGILTTAAAVLMYHLFGTTTALIIALIYIVYGIIISYVKANEGLTIFVMLVSLLLPYMLEYMDSSMVVIIGFIIVLFVTMEWITVQLKQKYAQMIISTFTGISILTLYGLNDDSLNFTLISWIILMAVSSLAWILLHPTFKSKALAISINYSLSAIALIAFWVLLYNSNQALFGLILVLAFLGVTYVAWKKNAEFDMFVAITFLTLVVFIANLSVDGDVKLLLMIIASSIGLYFGLEQGRKFMRITNGALLFIQTSFVYGIFNIETGLEWMLHVTPLIVGGILIYPLVQRNRLPKLAEVIQVLVYLLLLSFIVKIEIEYIHSYYQYLSLAFVAITALVAFMISEKWIGKIVPYIALALFVVTNFVVISLMTSLSNWQLELIVFVTYVIVWLGYIVSFVQKKWLYNKINISKVLNDQWVVIFSSIGLTILLWKVAGAFETYGWITNTLFIIISTVVLFILSVFFLLLGKNGRSACLKAGLVVLIIAIGKLMFVDLSYLSLFIRAIFFMIVGGIGLVITNKMLKQQKGNKE